MLAESPNSVSFLIYGAFNETLQGAHISPAGIRLWIRPTGNVSAFRLLVLSVQVALQKTLNSNLEHPLTFLSKSDTFGMGTRSPSGIKKE